MDQTDTIWYPTDTILDTSPIYHIRCTFAHTNSHVSQQEFQTQAKNVSQFFHVMQHSPKSLPYDSGESQTLP